MIDIQAILGTTLLYLVYITVIFLIYIILNWFVRLGLIGIPLLWYAFIKRLNENKDSRKYY